MSKSKRRTKVLIEVMGGVVTLVSTNNADIDCYLADYDNLKAGANLILAREKVIAKRCEMLRYSMLVQNDAGFDASMRHLVNLVVLDKYGDPLIKQKKT